MADGFTTFDIIAVGAVIVALTTVIGVLWNAFKNQVDELKAEREKDRAEIEDLIGRVRTLEEQRLNEVKEYAGKLERIQGQSNAVFTRAINVLQDIVKYLAGFSARKCQAGEPTPLPEVDTETLVRRADKVEKARAAEYDRP